MPVKSFVFLLSQHIHFFQVIDHAVLCMGVMINILNMDFPVIGTIE